MAGDHRVTDLYYSLNFDLIKVSDSKASTIVVISGQSILITAFLLANILGEAGVDIIAIGFSLSIIFNVVAVFFALSALQPRSFQETSSTLQPLYTSITKHTREKFIEEFLKLSQEPKEENDRHFAEIIYQISSILEKKMHRVFIATRIFFFGIGVLVVSIFILVFEIFIL